MSKVINLVSRFWAWLNEPEPKPDTYRVGDDETPPWPKDGSLPTGGTTGNVGGFGDVM